MFLDIFCNLVCWFVKGVPGQTLMLFGGPFAWSEVWEPLGKAANEGSTLQMLCYAIILRITQQILDEMTTK